MLEAATACGTGSLGRPRRTGTAPALRDIERAAVGSSKRDAVSQKCAIYDNQVVTIAR